jgi:hypothetical protein
MNILIGDSYHWMVPDKNLDPGRSDSQGLAPLSLDRAPAATDGIKKR